MNAVRSKQITKNAVKTPEIADGAVTAPKLADGVEGLQGSLGPLAPPGADGANGADGAARAYAFGPISCGAAAGSSCTFSQSKGVTKFERIDAAPPGGTF